MNERELIDNVFGIELPKSQFTCPYCHAEVLTTTADLYIDGEVQWLYLICGGLSWADNDEQFDWDVQVKHKSFKGEKWFDLEEKATEWFRERYILRRSLESEVKLLADWVGDIQRPISLKVKRGYECNADKANALLATIRPSLIDKISFVDA